jgi:hypothetical protein
MKKIIYSTLALLISAGTIAEGKENGLNNSNKEVGYNVLSSAGLQIRVQFQNQKDSLAKRRVNEQVQDTIILHRDLKVSEALHGDTVIMENIHTGEKRKARIISPERPDEKKSKTSIKIVIDQSRDKDNRDTVKIGREEDDNRRSRPIFGITVSRLDWGFSRLVADGKFSMSGDNEILDYKPGKTSTFGVDLLQMGYKFSPNFRMFVSGGFDWTYIRLTKPVEFDPKQSPYDNSQELNIGMSKNRLTSTYLRVPLTIEVKSDDVRFAAGPMLGFLLKGTQRYKFEDGDAKLKRRGDYGFTPIQYGAFARVGYRQFGIFAKYYMNDMFENSPNGAEINNLSFGLTLGF